MGQWLQEKQNIETNRLLWCGFEWPTFRFDSLELVTARYGCYVGTLSKPFTSITAIIKSLGSDTW